MNLEAAVALYESELSKILNKHAPLKSLSLKNDSPEWLTKQCQEAKTMRRKAERIYLKCPDPDTKKIFRKCSVKQCKFSKTM